MRVLVLWADDKSMNLGVRALAAGTQALGQRVWPNAEFVFYSYGGTSAPVPLASPRRLAKEVVTRQSGLTEWFRGFDVVMDTRAGDSFSDIYGKSRLSGMCLATEYAARTGVPIVLSPQTIGPFGSVLAKTLAWRSLRTATTVMARDSLSAVASARMGRPVDALTTDVVFALDVPEVAVTRDVVLNISGLLWQPGRHVDSGQYRQTVIRLYDALVGAGRSVSLMAHVLSSTSPDDDVPAIEEFQREHAPHAEVLVPSSLGEARRLLAGSSLVVGSRMHACLNALSVGTPAIPLAYSRKFAPLMADLGWQHVLDLRTQSEAATVARVVEIAQLPHLREHVARVRRSADTKLDLATEALAKLPVPRRMLTTN